MKNPSHCIVVDADVARSSGLSEHPISSSCRKMLDLMRKNDHKLVACSQLLSEWKKHASLYSAQWLNSMIARRQVCFIRHENEIRLRIEVSSTDDKIKDIALKDSHIVDAAHVEGKFIASRDESAKQAFMSISEIRAIVHQIAWINPVKNADMTIPVLQERGSVDELRMVKE